MRKRRENIHHNLSKEEDIYPLVKFCQWDEIFCCKLFRMQNRNESRDQESRGNEIQTGRIQEKREGNMKLEGALGIMAIMAIMENTVRSIKDRNDESKMEWK